MLTRGVSSQYHLSVAFRDSFDQCPRCGIQLEDAHSARGCSSCGGVFIEEPVLAEMILQMLPPPPRVFGPLRLSAITREGTTLACPSCGEAMHATEIHEVELDRCGKHGVWFDPDELRIALYRVAQPDNPPPFDEWVPAPRIAPPAPAPPAPPARIDSGAPRLLFRVEPPSGVPREVSLQLSIVKIGKLSSAQLNVSDDDTTSRMHAIIEATADAITIIDLGSDSGTLVNGTRVNKTRLKVGDTIQVGNTTIRLESFTAPGDRSR